MIELRSLEAGEWPEAMKLWTDVFGDLGWVFETLNVATEERTLEHTKVAVAEGKIVSAVDIFVRHQRDVDGYPLKVGAIGSVATFEEFRGRGLSGQLLLEAIEFMKAVQCEWSFLATGVPNHYARYGWFTTPLTHWRGSLRSREHARNLNVVELETSDPLPFGDLSRIYDDFNRTRPLTHLRSLHYWEHAIWIRLSQPGMRLFVYEEDSRVVGYLAASFVDSNLEVVEIGCESGREDVLRPLLERCARESVAVGIRDWSFAMAIDESYREAVDQLITDLETFEAPWTMSRPVSGSVGENRIIAIFAAEGATHYHLDRF